MYLSIHSFISSFIYSFISSFIWSLLPNTYLYIYMCIYIYIYIAYYGNMEPEPSIPPDCCSSLGTNEDRRRAGCSLGLVA